MWRIALTHIDDGALDVRERQFGARDKIFARISEEKFLHRYRRKSGLSGRS
jgi:hypothetical protein